MKGRVLTLIKIFSDLHITKESIPECKGIVEELCQEDQCHTLWFLGDTFHSKNARDKRLYAEEIEFFVWMLRKFNERFTRVLWLDGNHDQVTETLSLISFSKMLFPNIEVVGRTHDLHYPTAKHKIYLGHHQSSESGEFVSDPKYKVADLDKGYDLWLLGDNHKHMKLGKSGYHIGSARRVSFNEVDYGRPVYGILDLKTLKIEFKPFQSAIPMQRVESMAELKKVAQNGSQAQIQLVFKSFQTFIKNVDKLPDFEKKFHKFSVKHDYTKTYGKKKNSKKVKSFDEIFDKYLETVKNKRVRELILEAKNGK